MVLLSQKHEKLSECCSYDKELSQMPFRKASVSYLRERRKSGKRHSVPAHGISPDYYVKIVLLGDCSTGKTTLSGKYRDDAGNLALRRTSGNDIRNVEYYDKMVKSSGKVVLARLYDTAGQEKYRSLTASYYRGAHGCLILYDVTKESSFNNISYWLHDLKEYTSQPEIATILVGTKCHVNEESREVTLDRAQKYAESVGLPYMEVSAEEGINVTAVFEKLADLIIDTLCKDQAAPVINPTNRVTLEKPSKKKQWCSC